MTMEDDRSTLPTPKRTPWNKGKLIGAKPPLLARHVWSIRTKLQIERRTRDLAMFNLAIDSKLRGCDVIAIRVEDIAPNGYALARATVRQRKTGRPVRFELTEQTRQAVDDYLKVTGKVAGGFLLTSPALRVERVGYQSTRLDLPKARQSPFEPDSQKQYRSRDCCGQ
jgi:integrase